MRPRFSLLGLMILVAVVGIGLGLVLLVVRARQAMQLEVMRERERAEYALARSLLAEADARKAMGAQRSSKGDSTDAGRPTAAAGRTNDEFEGLRRENSALRARVDELERRLKTDDKPAPPETRGHRPESGQGGLR
jgi:hypothetical protein